MKHILEVVLDQDDNRKLHLAMVHNGITSPCDLCELEYHQMYELQYPSNQYHFADLPLGNAGLLKAFKAYVAYQASIGKEIGENNWINITPDEFDRFRISNVYSSIMKSLPPMPKPNHPVSNISRAKQNALLTTPKKDISTISTDKMSTIDLVSAQDTMFHHVTSNIPDTGRFQQLQSHP